MYFGTRLPLGSAYGGPLFFAHYSFLGIDPRGLSDRYADYFEQNIAHTAINRAHCVANPNRFKGYGPDCWGLTASDTIDGYTAHSPTNDRGVISPPRRFPRFPMRRRKAWRRCAVPTALKEAWGEYGSRMPSARSTTGAQIYLAIDQGPIVVMIENYRRLIWKLFMSCPEIRRG
jgi:hypothetical protein